ncbi:MAG: cystathionine beta-lyase, partial [Rhodospirillaceae bacterium]|nr:cystathionine beta-lyase [Rhodospirillaceae bacterium]
RVIHPALPNDPGYPLWKRDFTGTCGLFAMILKPVSDSALAAMLDEMDLFSMGFSWGGFESLILPIKPEYCRTETPWPPAGSKGGPLLRLHAGLEDIDDLIADLEAGFARLAAT